MADVIDLAADVVAAEAEAGVYRVRQALTDTGSDECVTCGDDIPEARRKAMPSATRCIGCQNKSER